MRIGVFTFLLLLAACAQAQQENLIPAIGALDRGDYKQAIDSLRPLAAGGTIEAQYVLGTILEAAPAPFRDLEAAQAKSWRELAQRKPDPAEAGKNDASGSQRADPRRSKP